MRRCLALAVCIAVFGATAVQANYIPLDTTVVSPWNNYVTGNFLINTIGYSRTTGGSYDMIEFHVINYLSGTNWISSMEGTWSGVAFDGFPAPSMYFAGSGTTFKNNTKNQGGAGPAAPQSWVNFDSSVSSAVIWNTRTGTSPLYTVVGGNWYTTDNTMFLRPVDPTPASNPDLDDGNDETLIAKIYVQHGGSVSFNGKFNVYNPSTHGSTTLTGTLAIAYIPEPSTLALLTIGLIGLLAYAWRRRA
jgi:hypothetical protein